MRATATILLGLAVEVAGGATPSQPTDVERLVSPNGRIAVAVHTAPRLSYDVLFDGRPLLQGATLSLDVDGVRLGATRADHRRRAHPHRRDRHAACPADRRASRRPAQRPAPRLRRRLRDHLPGLRSRRRLPVRDVAPARRGEDHRRGGELPLRRRRPRVLPREESFFSHNERQFKRVRLGELPAAALGSIPAVVETSAGPKVAIAESDLEDYPGLWLRGTGGPALIATFPPTRSRKS